MRAVLSHKTYAALLGAAWMLARARAVAKSADNVLRAAEGRYNASLVEQGFPVGAELAFDDTTRTVSSDGLPPR